MWGRWEIKDDIITIFHEHLGDQADFAESNEIIIFQLTIISINNIILKDLNNGNIELKRNNDPW